MQREKKGRKKFAGEEIISWTTSRKKKEGETKGLKRNYVML